MTEPWYRDGLRFECTRCGNCCTSHGDYAYIYLRAEEADAIAIFLEQDPDRFRRERCEDDDGLLRLVAPEPRCPFLSEAGSCGVYPVRPMQCRTWPFWHENLRREVWEGPVRETCPGIGRGRRFTREEVERTADEHERWYDEA